MKPLEKLKKHLKKGEVYRRADLAQWSKAVDRHLDELLADGTLEKLAQGLYYVRHTSVFGPVPPDESTLLKSYLKDDRFLVTSPNAYNSLGVGTTQLYNTRVVYNHKHHGEVVLGKRTFRFHRKPHFPGKMTPEFLLVDLMNNLDQLAEDKAVVLPKIMTKVQTMNATKFKSALTRYGTEKTKKLFKTIVLNNAKLAHAH